MCTLKTTKSSFIPLLGLFFLFLAVSCQKQESKSGAGAKTAQTAKDQRDDSQWNKGDCIDKALSPYIYQIAEIEGTTVYLYKMGVMGKKVIQKSLSELKEGKEPFSKVPCP